MAIAVVGSINCDVIAYLKHLPKPGGSRSTPLWSPSIPMVQPAWR